MSNQLEIDFWTNDELLYNYVKKNDYNYDDLLRENTNFEVKNTHRVTANIATQPNRLNTLMKTIESIKGQFDEIRIYLNEYTSVPDCLKPYTTQLGGNLTDNAKFFWSENSNEYYFTLDDDIIYPPDYVSKTLPLIGNRIVTYNGHKLFNFNKSFYNDQFISIFNRKEFITIPIDVPGTGVMAFDTDYFKPTLWRTSNYKVSDLLIGLEALLYNNPVFLLKREDYWLRAQDVEGIFEKYRYDDDYQTKFSDMIQIYRGKEDIPNSPLFFDEKSNQLIIDKMLEFNYLRNYYQIGLMDSKLIVSVNFSNLFSKVTAVESSAKKKKIVSKYFLDNRITGIELLNRFYHRVEFNQPSFIFISDYYLIPQITEWIFDKSVSGSIIFCSKIINNRIPMNKIKLKLTDNTDVIYYIYQKN